MSGEKLSCRECWFRLDKALRERIASAWAAKDAAAHRAALDEAFRWYTDHPLPAGPQRPTARGDTAVFFMAPPPNPHQEP